MLPVFIVQVLLHPCSRFFDEVSSAHHQLHVFSKNTSNLLRELLKASEAAWSQDPLRKTQNDSRRTKSREEMGSAKSPSPFLTSTKLMGGGVFARVELEHLRLRYF